MARIRRFKLDMIGVHGGEQISSKLDASIERLKALSPKVQRFRPNITVSFCSPEAARISFGLKVPHIGFCNAPHSEDIMRLTVPLLTKLLTPSHIPKRQFIKYGIDSENIVQYNAMDEFLILKNKQAPSKLPKMKLDKEKTILFRTYEAQAGYLPSCTVNTHQIIDSLLKKFPHCNIVVIARYADEIMSLKKKFGHQNIIILDSVVDSKAILSVADLFIGSGGTMTTEAVLRKVPSISYEAVPNLDEKYLVREKLLVRAKTPKQINLEAAKLLSYKNQDLKIKTDRFLSEMSDPFLALQSTIRSVKNV